MSTQYTAFSAACHTAPSPHTSPIGATHTTSPVMAPLIDPLIAPLIAPRSPPAIRRRPDNLRRCRTPSDPKTKMPLAPPPLPPCPLGPADEPRQTSPPPHRPARPEKNAPPTFPASACESNRG